MASNTEMDPGYKVHFWGAAAGATLFAGSLIGLVVTAEPIVTDEEISAAHEQLYDMQTGLQPIERELSAEMAASDIDLDELLGQTGHESKLGEIVLVAQQNRYAEELEDESDTYTLSWIAFAAAAISLSATSGLLVTGFQKKATRRPRPLHAVSKATSKFFTLESERQT